MITLICKGPVFVPFFSFIRKSTQLKRDQFREHKNKNLGHRESQFQHNFTKTSVSYLEDPSNIFQGSLSLRLLCKCSQYLRIFQTFSFIFIPRVNQEI